KITGSGLSGATGVKFGDNDASGYTVDNDGQITATSPAGSAGTVDVTVTTAGGTSATGSADRYTYEAPPPPPPPSPAVSGLSPASGPAAGGTSVKITGSGLSGATGVKFGGKDASSYTVDNDGQITATSPAGSAGAVDVTVTGPGGTSATSVADQYTYIAAPSVTGISPASGAAAAGTSV